jgi:hypothetical protein
VLFGAVREKMFLQIIKRREGKEGTIRAIDIINGLIIG